MNAHSHVNTTDKTDTFLNDITEELGEPERCAVVLERAAKRLKVELVPVDARITQEVDSAVARLSKRSVDAVLVSTVMILATRAEQIVQASVRHACRQFTLGNLISTMGG